MQIGMVTACYKPVINGVTRMIDLYKQHLQALGHKVTIFTLGDPDPAGDEPEVVRSPAISLGDEGYYFSTRYSDEAQDLLRQMDIIHCHHLFMGVDLAHRYGQCPIVYTNHTRYDLYTGAYIQLPQPAADAIMRQVWPDYTDMADVVITPSATVQTVMQEFGVRARMEVIENGVDRRPFLQPERPFCKSDLGLPEEAVLAVYVGRLASEKNLEILLNQFALASELEPRLRLLLLGKGGLLADLHQQAEQLTISDKLLFAGGVDYGDVPNYLAAADFFATASVSEVHPLTLIEAMAAGLPIAGTVSPGIADIVETGVTGFLTSDPERGLAAAMMGLAAHDTLRQQMGAAAKIASERYDIGQTVAQTVALYEELRRDRPDLRREQEHGRWLRRRDRLQPLVDQLARLLKEF